MGMNKPTIILKKINNLLKNYKLMYNIYRWINNF